MREKFTEERFAIAVNKMVLKATQKSLKSLGYRLKVDMSNAIRTGQMGWAPIRAMTLALRKRFKNTIFPGVYYARFTRYAVLEEGTRFNLKVGVFNPPGLKSLGKSIIAGAGRLVRGWKTVATERTRKRLIAQFLGAKGIKWKDLSKEQKRQLRNKMRKLGLLVRTGTVMKAPPRPTDIYLKATQNRTQNEFSYLLSKALKGEKWPRKWWLEVKV